MTAADEDPAAAPKRLQYSRGLAYLREGRGLPVVFVHGTCGDWRTYDLIRPAVSKRFEYVAYSRRGHHPNPASLDPEDYGLDAHVRDLAGLVEELRLAPIHLVGNSRGGLIALKLVLEHPELVRAAVVGEPGDTIQLASGGIRARLAAERAAQLATVLRLASAGRPEEAARQLFDIVVGREGAFDELAEDRRRRWLDNAHTLAWRAGAGPFFSAEDLKRARRPLLVVRGAVTSPYYRVMTELLMAHLPRGTREAVIPGAGHMSYVDNPEAFTRALLGFLELSS